MKLPTLILLSALIIGLLLSGCINTPAPADQSDYSAFDYVTNIDGFNKDALYDGVELWIAENFKSAKHVIDFENKEQGIIIGNGSVSGIILDGGMVKLPEDASFKMKVEVRDNKIRLRAYP